MGRKNRNAVRSIRRQRKLDIPRNHHFVYSVNDDGSEASIVRYLGDQEGDHLYCYHPSGFPLWIHVSQLSNPSKQKKAVAA